MRKMVDRNPHTGAALQSKPPSDTYRTNYESIFRATPKEAKTIFVFGSNLSGYHGLGSAQHARLHFRAMEGIGQGRTGDAYAIPTKDARLKSLSLATIQWHVQKFREYAAVYQERSPHITFQVVDIGCGYAGYTIKDIAPMFVGCPANCKFTPEMQHAINICARGAPQ